MTVFCVICFGIVVDMVIIDGIAPALGTGPLVRVHAGARHCQLSEWKTSALAQSVWEDVGNYKSR